ncbi:hypothetical protein [Serratia sp. szju]|uniref:hypothetical protein n=1 Tax=Serratia sp. szju TaxID=3375638 RepID=UPI0037DD4BE9
MSKVKTMGASPLSGTIFYGTTDNKPSELSKPVAWEVKGILCHSEEEARVYVGEPEPLYSQEYVSALLEEMGVRERSLISNCVDYEYDLIEMKRRAEAAEQRVAELEQAMKEQSNG